MDTRDFLLLFIQRAGTRTMGLLINGWKYGTYMRLAALTSYLKFECDFNKDGLCKKYRNDSCFSNADPKKAKATCCCHGCHSSVGYIHQLPADFNIIENYAKLFNNDTGFWGKGGCALPRSYRSPTCLKYNCDHNTCRPDSHKHLIQCLLEKRGYMTINGKKTTEFNVPAAMEKWLKEEPTYKTAQGSIDYAP